jgi:two-component system response regulator FixJ
LSTEPRVFVVDDDEPFRRSLVFLLRSAGFRAEGYVDAEHFLLSAPLDAVGCVVTDLRMPRVSGLDLQAALLARGSTLGFVFVSAFAGVRDATQAMREGAVDFLEKPIEAERLLARVRDALAKSAEQSQRADATRRAREGFERLTPREREILAAVVAGQRSREIAEAFAISPRTVEVHRAHIMEKMEAESVADLVRAALLLRDAALPAPDAAGPERALE